MIILSEIGNKKTKKGSFISPWSGQYIALWTLGSIADVKSARNMEINKR